MLDIVNVHIISKGSSALCINENLLLFFLIQIQGIEDLYVFDGGSVTVDTNGSIGMITPAHVSLKSLHVQDKGTFQMDSHTIDKIFVIDATNITVSFINNIIQFFTSEVICSICMTVDLSLCGSQKIYYCLLFLSF
jgi:hypothetical protein